MEFVLWLAGVLATVTACKFVFAVFKRISSKDNLADVIDIANQGISNGANKLVDSIKKRKERKHEEKPIVTIH